MWDGKRETGTTSFRPFEIGAQRVSLISWHFCYTGKSCEGLTEDAKQSKLTALVVHDSHSGAVHCSLYSIRAKSKT